MIHFLSDLHLSARAPAITERFLAYLGGPARGAERVFILGDLFEAWVGDDALQVLENTFLQTVADALARLTACGTELLVMHGNRDFLLGEAFSARTGAKIIPDPCLFPTSCGVFALSHGDVFCVGDVEYQALRATIRSKEWQGDFLSRSLPEREALVAVFRSQSIAANQKNGAYADLDTGAVEDFLRQQNVAAFIHGHIHRSGTYEHLIEGACVSRWSLACWDAQGGEYLSWNGARLIRHAA